MNLSKPLLRGHFHEAMFYISLGACSLLIAKSNSSNEKVSTIIYSIATLAMFGISALYHRINWSDSKRAVMKKLDHAAIYIKIAGTFTPICMVALSSESGNKLLTIIWVIALIGTIQSLIFAKLPKILSSIIYLFMGYLITPFLPELIPSLGSINIYLLVLGGISYTIGAMAYGLKKPVLWPKYFGYHEVFHIFVNLGATLHFILIYNLIR